MPLLSNAQALPILRPGPRQRTDKPARPAKWLQSIPWNESEMARFCRKLSRDSTVVRRSQEALGVASMEGLRAPVWGNRVHSILDLAWSRTRPCLMSKQYRSWGTWRNPARGQDSTTLLGHAVGPSMSLSHGANVARTFQGQIHVPRDCTQCR